MRVEKLKSSYPKSSDHTVVPSASVVKLQHHHFIVLSPFTYTVITISARPLPSTTILISMPIWSFVELMGELIVLAYFSMMAFTVQYKGGGEELQEESFSVCWQHLTVAMQNLF
ncbi:hypothetical protein DAI22_03g211750 [Oryza sativa Japonica Group]|nr:hypothetical protein DAI22_03g211750 [Oryza sativa Japonica Group]